MHGNPSRGTQLLLVEANLIMASQISEGPLVTIVDYTGKVMMGSRAPNKTQT
jgi:hypothetical protein